jgi:hypothetical protein
MRKTKNKLDLANNACSLKANTLIVLDDCHAWFKNEPFWIKLRHGVTWMDTSVSALLVATQLLSKNTISPMCLKQLPTMAQSQLALSIEEMTELIDTLVDDPSFKQSSISSVIMEESNGIAGLVAMSVGGLDSAFDSSLLQHYFSSALTATMSRCFGVDPVRSNSSEEVRSFLVDIFSFTVPLFMSLDPASDDQQSVEYLVEAGVLVKPDVYIDSHSFSCRCSIEVIL